MGTWELDYVRFWYSEISYKSNIWQRSLHPNPRKFSIRKVKKHFGSNLVPDEMNMSTCTPVGCRYRSTGRAWGIQFWFQWFHWADSPHQSR
ncbi:hypothetical protein J6590_094127 [Homalodisca vitripennis]|nr:hypothetical protein J6590_094127 [Homalodisca vitripennis]